MHIEVESSYVETVCDESDEIIGTCIYLDDRIDDLLEILDPANLSQEERDGVSKYVEDLGKAVNSIRKCAETIRTA